LSQHQVAKYLRILRHQPNHAKKTAGTVLTFQITNYKIKRFMYKTTRAATKILVLPWQLIPSLHVGVGCKPLAAAGGLEPKT
jgi:hypothetical protein